MLVADTHVHFYPAYDVAVALECAYRNLRSLGRMQAALLLTERHDCFFFRDLSAGTLRLPAGFTCQPGPDPASLLVERPSDGLRLWLLAGRQVVTRDGIEVLALLTKDLFADRQDTRDTLARIRSAGGLPVLPWSPGKWLGRRGGVIRDLIKHAGEEPLALGDTSLRPCCAPTPSLMRMGRERGLPVLAGSDPLPFRGDETATGRYAVRFTSFDERSPVPSIRDAILRRDFSVVGRRDPLPRMIIRWLRNQRVRGKAV